MPSARRADRALFLAAVALLGLCIGPLLHALEHAREARDDEAEAAAVALAWEAGSTDPLDLLASALEGVHRSAPEGGERGRHHSHGPAGSARTDPDPSSSLSRAARGAPASRRRRRGRRSPCPARAPRAGQGHPPVSGPRTVPGAPFALPGLTAARRTALPPSETIHARCPPGLPGRRGCVLAAALLLPAPARAQGAPDPPDAGSYVEEIEVQGPLPERRGNVRRRERRRHHPAARGGPRVSGVLRYSRGVGDAKLALTAMGYCGIRDPTDQIPARALTSGQIDRFGTVAPGAAARRSGSASPPTTGRTWATLCCRRPCTP